MRAKRIAPHRNTIFVRRTECKNFCASHHTNVYNFVNPKDGVAAVKPREEQSYGALASLLRASAAAAVKPLRRPIPVFWPPIPLLEQILIARPKPG